MKQIAHELTIIVRRDAKTDWNIKKQVRAKVRSTLKLLLLQHGYPPDPGRACDRPHAPSSHGRGRMMKPDEERHLASTVYRDFASEGCSLPADHPLRKNGAS